MENVMLGRVFKAYDIRGTYPDLLNDQMAWQIGWGAARFLFANAESQGQNSPMMRNIVVGRDMRRSSPALSEQLVSGIQAFGGHVIDVGLVDTPFVYFAVNHLGCAGGIMVTASHNPPQYNGFKISKIGAKPVGEATGLAEVRKFAATADRNTGQSTGRIEKRDLWDAYAKHVLAFLDLGGKSLKVVIDASNGMAGTMVPKIFGKGGKNIPGLEISEINFDNSKGEFVHEPNPLVASNLVQTREAVVAQGADLGICFDGDADRCVVIDEKGQAIGCDHLTAALAAHFLKERPGAAVIYDLRSTKAVEETIREHGGKPIRSRVGHVFMKQEMANHKAAFGGELSGHFYFRKNFNADSGAIAMATVLTVLARSGKKMSQLVAPAKKYAQSGEINFQIEEPDAALEALHEDYLDVADIDELDGITIDAFASHGWWCNIRKSNTEPLLRLNAEATDAATLEKILAELAPKLGTRVAH
jgi:phosphomannomutase